LGGGADPPPLGTPLCLQDSLLFKPVISLITFFLNTQYCNAFFCSSPQYIAISQL
jgi:hypothetical protein